MDPALQSSSGCEGSKQVTNGERNKDLELGEIGFRGNKDSKDQISNICRTHYL